MNSIRLALLIAVLLPGCAFAGTPASEQPDVSLADLQGQQHSLAEYHGKVTVVNFWATWCGPCKHEMPLLVDAAKHYGSDRVQVVAISLDDSTTQSKISGFAEKERMSFPILLGSIDMMQKLGLGEAVPATVFIDADGRIVGRILGEISKSELKARLEWLLSGKTGKQPAELVNNLNKKRDDDVPSVPMMR